MAKQSAIELIEALSNAMFRVETAHISENEVTLYKITTATVKLEMIYLKQE